LSISLVKANCFLVHCSTSLNELPGSDPLLSYTSDANATNYGFEIEIRKNFDFLDKLVGTKMLFRNFTFTMNYARIFSEVKIEGSAAASGLGTRPLQGQSPYIINSSLQYYYPKSGLSVALFVNRVGRRIAFVREKNGLIPDLWENPRTVVDLSIARKIYKGLEAKLTIGDLLAQDLIFYQDNNKNGKFDDISIKQRTDASIPVSEKANFDNTVYRFTNGYNVSLGVSYRF
jgi:outer membrane receptor protein involved in Fe transport